MKYIIIYLYKLNYTFKFFEEIEKCDVSKLFM